ncbi:MAG: sugar phosphate isomerase/epimerase family protein [Streptosporangiaceae bacterium]
MHTVAPGERTADVPGPAAGAAGGAPRWLRSIATVSLPGTPLAAKLEAAARAGFGGVEICDADLTAGCASREQVRLRAGEMRLRAADLGLRIVLYQPFRDLEGVPDDVFEDNLQRAERAFTLMGDLGADTMLVCSSVSPAAVDDDERAAGQLHRLAELASQAYGVRVAYEALSWGRFVSDYQHAWRLVAAADHEALGICLDSFHTGVRGDDPSAIRDIPGGRIFFVQLADAPDLPLDPLTLSRQHRCFPGQGVFDLARFAAAVRASGTSCPWSLEIFSDDLRQRTDPDRVAAEGMESLRQLEASIA